MAGDDLDVPNCPRCLHAMEPRPRWWFCPRCQYVSDPLEQAARDLADDRMREAYAVGLDASPEIHAAIAALALDFQKWLPDLADPFYATYVAGSLRYRASERGESETATAERLWSMHRAGGGDETAAREIAADLELIAQLIEIVRPWRPDIERPRLDG